jgi:hypothetical protein
MTECYSTLTKNNFKAKVLCLDNEVSKTLIRYIEETANLDYQLVSPHNHRANPAERAIQTYKAHFISILSGVHPDFPDNCWDLLIPHTNLTLNIHRQSKLQPKLSAHTLIHGNFNFDKTPLAPPGCQVIIHDRTGHRLTWANRGTLGYYIGPALKHYRNYTCYDSITKANRVSDTIEFFPHNLALPETSGDEKLGIALENLTHCLSDCSLR